MDKDEKILTGGNPEEDGTGLTDFDLLNEVKRIKETTVPKEEYDKLLAEKKKLMKDFVYGSGDSSNVGEAKPNIEELRNKIFGDNVEQMSNRDFWKNVSELYHTRLEQDGENIFLPKGKKTRYERKDYEVVESMMNTIDSMLEDSKDNPNLFTTLFNEALN